MLFEAYLGLGSNLGDRAANITGGLESLRRLSRTMAISSMYETLPHGFQDQPSFLNAACALWTPLDAFGLMAEILAIQTALSGRRPFPNAPRALDIDILVHGRAAVRTPWLEVPHPLMADRPFVLVPLAEIAPGLRHPVLGISVRDMLARLPLTDREVTRLPRPRPLQVLHGVYPERSRRVQNDERTDSDAVVSGPVPKTTPDPSF